MLITENGKAEKWKTIRSGCMSNPYGVSEPENSNLNAQLRNVF